MLRAKNVAVSGDYLNGTIWDALGTLYITEPLVFGVVEVSRKTVIAIEDPETTRKKRISPNQIKNLIEALQKKQSAGSIKLGFISGMENTLLLRWMKISIGSSIRILLFGKRIQIIRSSTAVKE